MAASKDHSSGPVPGPDQEPWEPRPWPGPQLAWLPPQCQAFPSEPRSWAVMAGGPGLLPGSLPASQAPGQGWAAPCNHHCPGWPARRALLERRTGRMLPCCGLSTRLGRAVCQGLQVPAWIPAPSQGAFGEAGRRHLPPSGCTCLAPLLLPPPDPPSGSLETPALPTLPDPSACTQTAGEEQVLDRTPAPSPDPRGSLPPLAQGRSGLARGSRGRLSWTREETPFSPHPRNSPAV